MTVTINGTSGVTAPEVTLDNSAADGGQVVLKSSGYSNWNIDNYNGSLRNYYGSTVATTIDSSGNMGIGTSSPTTKLHIEASTGTARAITLSDTGGATPVILGNTISGGTANFVATVGGSERMRIDSSGNLLVGKTSYGVNSGVGVQVGAAGTLSSTKSTSTNADDTLHVYSTGVSAYRFYVGLGGTVYATNTTISAISDQRFKENVRDLDAGLNEILALKPRKFDWKEGKGANVKDARGFIAQEFEQVFPDLIDEWKDPAPEGEEPYKSVRQDLIPVLVRAIQELSAKNDALEARITALETK